MRLKTALVSSQYAVLEWRPPKILADTVKTYHLNIRKLGSGDEYTVVEKVRLDCCHPRNTFCFFNVLTFQFLN
jgi:hypothetical protein